MPPVGLILLAAGASTRLGRAKQLLVFKGNTLLRHAAETAMASACRPIVIVTGAMHEELLPEIRGLEVITERNVEWQRGMGTSLRAGLRGMLRHQPDAGAAVILLCDQPHVNGDVLSALVEAHRATAKPVIASAYAGTFGPPCLFAASQFPALMAGPDGQGA